GSDQLLSATLILTEQSALRVDRKVPARMISLNKQLRSGVGLGLIGTVLLSATPAFADVAAPKDCGLPGTTINFAVTLAKRLDIASGTAITLEPVPGGFAISNKMGRAHV